MQPPRSAPFDPSHYLGNDSAMLRYLTSVQRCDPFELLPDENTRAEYLAAALETGDVEQVDRARFNIRRARAAEAQQALADGQEDALLAANVLRFPRRAAR